MDRFVDALSKLLFVIGVVLLLVTLKLLLPPHQGEEVFLLMNVLAMGVGISYILFALLVMRLIKELK